jgi:CBS domain-containing protein
MTSLVVTVPASAGLAEVADVLDAHRIGQVPVMSDGRLVGIISRADLVRKLAEAKVAVPEVRADNGMLQKAIWDQIKAEPWLKSVFVNFMVKDGVVELWGAVDSEEQRRALRVLVESVPGVRKVVDQVGLLPKVAGL